MILLDSKITQKSEFVDTLSKEFHAFKKDLPKHLDTTLGAMSETLLEKINGINTKGAKRRGRLQQADNEAPPSVAGSGNSEEQQRSRSARAQRERHQSEQPE